MENLLWAATFASAIASLAVRYRHDGDAERCQLLWLLLVGACRAAVRRAGVGLLGSGPILGLLVLPLIPAAVTIAILRYQLLDIRLVVSRALLYVLLTARFLIAGLASVPTIRELVEGARQHHPQARMTLSHGCRASGRALAPTPLQVTGDGK